MKIKQLKEQEPLQIIEVSKQVKIPNRNLNNTLNSNTVEVKQIQMRVFTDGQIEKEDEEIKQNIEEYYIGKRNYKYDVDTLKTKNIYLKNHSYAIVFLIANEWVVKENVQGWFDVVKDISIYLEDLKDKKSLKRAKQIIKNLENNMDEIDYSSIFSMLGSQNEKVIGTNDDSVLGKYKYSENCSYVKEKYSPLAYEKFENEQGVVLKKTRI